MIYYIKQGRSYLDYTCNRLQGISRLDLKPFIRIIIDCYNKKRNIYNFIMLLIKDI